MKEYNHKEIESKWKKEWKEKELYKVADKIKDKENEYILVEFPYPSGNLHVGHWYAFAVSDIYARYRRMLGKNVLFPIGFDSFGLPAENAAIKNNVNPRDWTDSNIEYMTAQLDSMGAMFDLNRLIVTSKPEYYKWTQFFFTKFFENGLAYQAENFVNWCPSCKTVLANEQVIAGRCDRCDSEIEQKKMREWKLRITKYAEKLLEGLDRVDWPNHIREAQRNWIGKSEGTFFDFIIKGREEKVEVFTTRPDTYFGITYLVLAPEAELVDSLRDSIINWEEVLEYRKITSAKTELQRISEAKEKTGVELKGIRAFHSGLNEEIPVFISDYVIANYGTGSVMAVPAHDARDFAFAQKFGLKITEVISGEDISKNAYEEHGTLINSKNYSGLHSIEAMKKITNDFGKKTTNYRIRDWSVSRQRYWGCPIPVIHCEDCGTVSVPEKDLPVILPNLEDFTPNDNGKSPLSKAVDWVNVKCPKCNKDAKRETDTLDTFIDSSWYFLRYTDPKNTEIFANKEKLDDWMPVDFYSGGNEHTTMHLLYARFFQKALFDLDLVVNDEPFIKRNNRGLILGPDGTKMSKSKGNVIDPDELVEQLGADTVRAYLAFIGPYNEAGSYPWDPNGVVGTRRFIERIVALEEKISDSDSDEVLNLLHKTIKGIGEDYQALKFNTAISKAMILSNLLDKEMFSKETYKTLIKIIAPVVPHICEELWESQGEKESVHLQKWPDFEHELTQDKEVKVVIQVNGKFREKIDINPDIEDTELKRIIKTSITMKKWLSGKKVKRIIYIKNRLMNFVLEEDIKNKI